MKEQKYGRIVNVASVGGRTGRPGVGVNYAASKAGIIGLTQTLARELAPWNITANAVAPGPLKGRLFLGMAPELIENLEKGIPLGRVGEMDEVAYALLYLASDEASWTTGEVLDVNGGAYI
jgi:Dehydrogenases with different specificities (related to short-chain alcohol dehydrogenases)